MPSAIVSAVGAPLTEILFIATPVPYGEHSGVLLLWQSGAKPASGDVTRASLSEQVMALAPAFSQMMSDRRIIRLRRISAQRFHDLFGSVPISIVMFEGDGQTGLINAAAAGLLGLAAGELPAREIAGPMRELRMRCKNAEALSHVYDPQQGNINYAAKALWDLGAVKLEVDTHPILGNGRNGRIWIFNDVTAQQAVQERLRQLSFTDPLTGLSNRRHFIELGSRAFENEAGRGKVKLAALMIDIDHFKAVNDTYGHHIGDEVLQAVAARLRGELRERDLIARMGGEEFAVLLEGLSPEQITEAGERLRASVVERPVRTSSAIVEIRVSIGIAIRDADDADLAALLTRADRALYGAKRAGRNRIVVDRHEDA